MIGRMRLKRNKNGSPRPTIAAVSGLLLFGLAAGDASAQSYGGNSSVSVDYGVLDSLGAPPGGAGYVTAPGFATAPGFQPPYPVIGGATTVGRGSPGKLAPQIDPGVVPGAPAVLPQATGLPTPLAMPSPGNFQLPQQQGFTSPYGGGIAFQPPSGHAPRVTFDGSEPTYSAPSGGTQTARRSPAFIPPSDGAPAVVPATGSRVVRSSGTGGAGTGTTSSSRSASVDRASAPTPAAATPSADEPLVPPSRTASLSPPTNTTSDGGTTSDTGSISAAPAPAEPPAPPPAPTPVAPKTDTAQSDDDTKTMAATPSGGSDTGGTMSTSGAVSTASVSAGSSTADSVPPWQRCRRRPPHHRAPVPTRRRLHQQRRLRRAPRRLPPVRGRTAAPRRELRRPRSLPSIQRLQRAQADRTRCNWCSTLPPRISPKMTARN